MNFKFPIQFQLPWKKKGQTTPDTPEPEQTNMQQQILDNVKANLITQIASQCTSYPFVNGMVAGFGKSAAQKLVTVLGWKKVPLVKPDPTEEKDDQDTIFNNFMGCVNGDRNITHEIPDNIDMKAFQNDSMPAPDRNQLYDVIDVINEALDIEREGKYRTEETMKEDNKQTMAQNGYATNAWEHVEHVMQPIGALLQPIVMQITGIVGSLLAAMIACKLIGAIDKIQI